MARTPPGTVRLLLSGGVCGLYWAVCDRKAAIFGNSTVPDKTPSCEDLRVERQKPFHFQPVWSLPVAAADNVQATRATPNHEEEEEEYGEVNGFHLLDLETRKRTFFKYEKRVRSLSTPEKIFEYFASIEDDGIKSMSHQDLLRALTAVYPPQGSTLERAGALLGEKPFFKLLRQTAPRA